MPKASADVAQLLRGRRAATHGWESKTLLATHSLMAAVRTSASFLRGFQAPTPSLPPRSWGRQTTGDMVHSSLPVKALSSQAFLPALGSHQATPAEGVGATLQKKGVPEAWAEGQPGSTLGLGSSLVPTLPVAAQ